MLSKEQIKAIENNKNLFHFIVILLEEMKKKGENNAKLLHELAMVFDLKDRSAQFHTTLVVARPGKESLVVEADWPGYINFEPKGEHGFGYDPLFLVGETGRAAAELTLEEKNTQSHRALAVKKLLEVFPSWQSKQSSL